MITDCVLCNISGENFGSKKGFQLHFKNDEEDYQEREYHYLKCPKCGLWWVSDPDENYNKLYESPEYWWKYHKARKWEAVDETARIENDLKYSHLRLPIIKQFCPKGVVLDIGCSTGTMLKVLSEAGGYIPWGMDMNVSVCLQARDYSHCKVFVGLDHFINCKDTLKFNLITAFDVVEHLTNPVETIATWATLLKPDGLLIIELPDAGCEGGLTHGVNWDLAIPMEHIYQYEKKHIKMLLEKLGFFVLQQCNPWSTERQRCIAQKIS